MLDDKLVQLFSIAAILQGSLNLFTAKLATLVGIEAVDQVGEKSRWRLGIQIAVGA